MSRINAEKAIQLLPDKETFDYHLLLEDDELSEKVGTVGLEDLKTQIRGALSLSISADRKKLRVGLIGQIIAIKLNQE